MISKCVNSWHFTELSFKYIDFQRLQTQNKHVMYASKLVCIFVCTTETKSLTWTSQEMDLSRYQLGSQGGSALKSKCSR